MSDDVIQLVSKLTAAVEDASALEGNDLNVSAPGEFDDQFTSDLFRFKTLLQGKISQIEGFIESCDRLTWIDLGENKEAFLIEIQRLIGSLGKYHAAHTKRLAMFNIVAKGLPDTKTLVIEYGYAIDDLLETIHDLDLVFFQLPNDPEFQATARKISQHFKSDE